MGGSGNSWAPWAQPARDRGGVFQDVSFLELTPLLFVQSWFVKLRPLLWEGRDRVPELSTKEKVGTNPLTMHMIAAPTFASLFIQVGIEPTPKRWQRSSAKWAQFLLRRLYFL
jgi:hypothetical protein